MPDNTRRTPGKSEKTQDPRSVRKFLEELSWLLTAHSNLDFRAIRNALVHSRLQSSEGLDSFTSENPNIHFLVGVLPGIFSDEMVFPNNEDIAEFAKTALNLQISRWEKRSRHELIGLVVCETANLNDKALAKLVRALQKLVSKDPHAQDLISTGKLNKKRNWNEIIQALNSEE